jgi:hypothetical protein
MVDTARRIFSPNRPTSVATHRLFGLLAWVVLGATALTTAGNLLAQVPVRPNAVPKERPVSQPPGEGNLPPPADPPGGPATTGPQQPPALPDPPPLSIHSVSLGDNNFTVTIPPPPRFQFKIAPNATLKDLLPPPPKAERIAGPLLGNDLNLVPEVKFQGNPALRITPEQAAKFLTGHASALKKPAPEDATKNIAHQIAKINHLNSKKTDGFVLALRDQRPDLSGLPFAMGDACRTKGERNQQFALAAATVRRALPNSTTPNARAGAALGQAMGTTTGAAVGHTGPERNRAEDFWEQFQTACVQEDRKQSKIDRVQCEHVALARIAALMQVLAPEEPELRLGLVKYLAGISHAEATRALARLAIFSAEDEVRRAALDALKVRRERDYTEILIQGLRYPLPAVAQRAADAVAKLERNDLVPQLVDLLDEPDPRAPVIQEVEKKKVPVVRELVRVNHQRSCLMCHSPGNKETVSPDTLTAQVPVPGEPLPTPSQGYANSVPDLLVRVDVTYLRQDFSLMQAVEDANPWPEMQRFDFLVRTRVLAEEEAQTYQAKLDKREPGQLSPYNRAVMNALRDLTGKDTEPTGKAWRKLLEKPAQNQ